MNSILLTIKKMLGLDQNYKVFDQDLIVYINTAIMILEQIGVGVDGFAITGEDELWTDLLTDINKLEGAKTYIYIRTRLAFDPPTNSSLLKSLEDTYKELEWRLNVKAEQMEV